MVPYVPKATLLCVLHCVSFLYAIHFDASFHCLVSFPVPSNRSSQSQLLYVFSVDELQLVEFQQTQFFPFVELVLYTELSRPATN